MKHLLLQKILAIVEKLAIFEELQNPTIKWIKARDFDHDNPRAKIPGDPKGRRWNPYVKKYAKDHGFIIVKHVKSNRNYYVLPQNRQALMKHLASL